jgi:glucose-1-phosphate thymidylyltransferase
MGRGFAWLDTGTPQSLADASMFVKIIEERKGIKIGCIEEVAYRKKLISITQMRELYEEQKNSEYGKYILKLCEKHHVF